MGVQDRERRTLTKSANDNEDRQMNTKNELLEQIREIDAEMAEVLVKSKAKKADIEAALAELLDDESEASREMSATLAKYRSRYTVSVAPSGRKSLNNGDEIAEILEGRDAKEVLVIAEQLLGLEAGELQVKYERLNVGQKRMNGGNRIRSAIKRGDVTVDDLRAVVTH